MLTEKIEVSQNCKIMLSLKKYKCSICGEKFPVSHLTSNICYECLREYPHTVLFEAAKTAFETNSKKGKKKTKTEVFPENEK